MTRAHPPNRLLCETVKVNAGGAKAYLQIDRASDGGPVEHIVITPSGKTGSDFQKLLQELTRLINHALQTRAA